jgi:small-conductance mechanosensitive channel
MIRKVISFLSLMTISFLLWFANSRYPHLLFQKALQTFLVLVIVYFIFSIVLEEMIVKRIKETKTKYSFKKTISILELVVLAIVTITIWVENPEALVVSYGLIAAGVAIALHDFFKNFVGGIVVFLTGIYRVGDRIEIDSNYGDVMDIGILYTTLMETKEWVSGDQATGRLKMIPNGQVLSNSARASSRHRKSNSQP